MILLQFLAIAATVILAIEIFATWKPSPVEIRKALALPTFLQIFALTIAWMRSGILPAIIPHEIITILIYFFSVYLTFTAIIAICAVEKKHRKLFAILWTFAAICFWLISLL